MLEILKYILSDIWRFCGFTIILIIILDYVVNLVLQLAQLLKNKK